MEKSSSSLSAKRRGNILENLFIIILAFYPLRHISWGLDLWDTGYNYANFQYMGTEHMDPMWLFSTYLANVTGNFLTGLPNADSLMGMNLYTGLFASVLALAGYFFCTRKLKMPKGIVFAGEFIALNLCWCPTALLYNYLTYVFFLAAVILLYNGLTREKKACFVCAGILLGTNVLVRFSNLPEAGMIVAVWAYDFIVWLEERKGGVPSGGISGSGKAACEQLQSGEKASPIRVRTSSVTEVSFRQTGAGSRTEEGFGQTGAGGELEEKIRHTGQGGSPVKSFFERTLRHTLWCLLGYAGALLVLLNYIHIRYGFGEYIAGIRRLFSMTETAVDYKASSMILGIVRVYAEELYWIIRFAVIILCGMALFAIAGWVENGLKGLQERAGSDGRKWAGMSARGIHTGVRIIWMGGCAAMLWWLYEREFWSLLFYSYDPIWHPGILFLILTMLVTVIRIFHKSSPREEKLISGLVLLIILITPLGSNNGAFPSLNNLFLAAPYTLWECWRFLRSAGEKTVGKGLVLSSFPARGFLAAFLGLCFFVFTAFGLKFVFAEATGVQNADFYVYNNEILKNIRMDSGKAQWMSELSEYVNEEGLSGKEVILYGKIPALSYYLQMPAAFNPWSDLDSYGPEVMKGELAEQEGRIREKGEAKPVIILENAYGLYEEEQRGEKSLFPLEEETRRKMEADPKWKMLMEFMESMEYEQTFRNEKFAVYQ